MGHGQLRHSPMLSTQDYIMLIDCNNFYVSCERVFQPRLNLEPVIVLSNNDGCVIARSNESKRLGIAMGEPFFKIKKFCEANNVHVFSSNHELYADISYRVMQIIKKHFNQVEIYSIDEAFVGIQAKPNGIDLQMISENLQKHIQKNLNIPTSIGTAKTKSLAKLANKIAKKNKKGSICIFKNKEEAQEFLHDINVDEIWGIGYQWSKKLKDFGIYSAHDLYQSSEKYLRKHFNVQMEKIILELRGIPCYPIEKKQIKQSISSSRSLKEKTNEKEIVLSHIIRHIHIASEKLRREQGECLSIQVQLIHIHNQKRYYNQLNYTLFMPTSDTSQLIGVAKKLFNQSFREDRFYKKTGIILGNIKRNDQHQMDIIHQKNKKSCILMKSIDSINKKIGKGSISFSRPARKKTKENSNLNLSKRYTTRWNELLKIK